MIELAENVHFRKTPQVSTIQLYFERKEPFQLLLFLPSAKDWALHFNPFGGVK